MNLLSVVCFMDAEIEIITSNDFRIELHAKVNILFARIILLVEYYRSLINSVRTQPNYLIAFGLW